MTDTKQLSNTAAEIDAGIAKANSIPAGAEPNRAQSSQAQAEAGVDSTTDMSPLRVAQAIAALAAGGEWVELASVVTAADQTQVNFDNTLVTGYKDFRVTGDSITSETGLGGVFANVDLLTSADNGSSFYTMNFAGFIQRSQGAPQGGSFQEGSSSYWRLWVGRSDFNPLTGWFDAALYNANAATGPNYGYGKSQHQSANTPHINELLWYDFSGPGPLNYIRLDMTGTPQLAAGAEIKLWGRREV